MNSEISKKIANTNIILTLLVVLLHSECLSYFNNTSSYYGVVSTILKFVLSICDVAVPTFFSISAYLFFINYDSSKYISKLKSRIKSLVVPYFCWSTIFLLFFIVISNMPQFKMFDGVFIKIEYNLLFIIKSILLSTYDGVLWYVRDLFILIIASPIIYFICKKLGIFNYVLVVLLILLNLYLRIDYYNPVYWLPIYMIASYFSINHSDKLVYFASKVSKSRILLLSFMLLFTALLIFYALNANNYYASYFYRFYSPVFIYIIILNTNIFNNKLKLAKYSFLLYCSHRWITIIIKKCLILFFGLNGLTAIFFQFLTFILTVLLLLIFIKILERLSPMVLNILSGNRLSRE